MLHMRAKIDTNTIIHALAWRCRTGIGRFPTSPWSLGGAAARLGARAKAADLALASPPPSELRLGGSACRHIFFVRATMSIMHSSTEGGDGNLGMVLCGCHPPHSFCFSELVIAFLVYWSLFC